MGFKEKWSTRKDSVDDDELISSDVSSSYKARSALSTLYASDYGYNDWKDIGISFKAAGGELSDWLAWCSIDASRYDEKVATQLFDSVSADGAITELTLWKLAWDAGWEWHERFEKIPTVKAIPKQREFADGDAQAIAQLEAMFEPDEYVNIVTKTTVNNKGKLIPSGYGNQYKRDELCNAIREVGLDRAIGGYNVEAGVWLRVNPMNGVGVKDTDVKSCRNALIESDDMSLKDQERMLFEMNLPIICITNSGGKSLHAIVKIDADGRNHYADRVRYLHDECNRMGMTIDKANKNPSRLTRLAGIKRGEKEQTLMHLRVGAKDFTTWMAQEKNAKLLYDYGIEPMDMEREPVLDEVLIDGIMRRGDKMCVAGPSKSYKSFSLIQLALAIACGGKWFGWKCKQGRVLYINCELRGESFRKRVWEVADGMSGIDRAVVQSNMDVWNMRGRTQPLSTSKDHIIEQAHDRKYDALILDPIYKLYDGDENSAQEVGEFLRSIDELALQLHASVIYCHHHSKGAKGGVSAQDRFSGSGVFARDCDELIDISPLDLKDHSITEWGFKSNATAWRVETVIRDFEPKYPLDVVFEYPVHIVDETGYLSDFSLLSPQSAGGNKSAVKRREQRDEKVAELETYCTEYYADNGTPLSSAQLAKVFEKSPRTIVNWANRAETLRVEQYGNANYIVMIDLN